MKKLILAVSIAGLALSGCTSAMNTVKKPGRMNESGEIRPCHRDDYDAQSCGNAIFNAKVIGKIHVGQPMSDVKAIMRHEAEKRRTDGTFESWGYITDYENREMTWVAFDEGTVTAIHKEPWSRD